MLFGELVGDILVGLAFIDFIPHYVDLVGDSPKLTLIILRLLYRLLGLDMHAFRMLCHFYYPEVLETLLAEWLSLDCALVAFVIFPGLIG